MSQRQQSFFNINITEFCVKHNTRLKQIFYATNSKQETAVLTNTTSTMCVMHRVWVVTRLRMGGAKLIELYAVLCWDCCCVACCLLFVVCVFDLK